MMSDADRRAAWEQRHRERKRGERLNAAIKMMSANREIKPKVSETIRPPARKLVPETKEKDVGLQRKHEAELAHDVRARKLLVAGDAVGNLGRLLSTVEMQISKLGAFDALLCVGSFLPKLGASSCNLHEFVNGNNSVMLDTYFVDDNAALIQAAPQGRQLCNRLNFLGGYGITEICKLRVAFLSGHYDPSVYDTHGVDFVGAAFTANAVAELKKLAIAGKREKGIDIFLTCGWPTGLEEKIPDSELMPASVDGIPSWKVACAPPFAELCVAIEPRYHIFGTANLFYQRPPFLLPCGDYVCRCIGLGTVGSPSKLQKWLHALSLSPMAYMKREDLGRRPADTLPCPFIQESLRQKRHAKEAPVDEPDAKRRASRDDGEQCPGSARTALEAVLRGDFEQLPFLLETMQTSMVKCGLAEDKGAHTAEQAMADQASDEASYNQGALGIGSEQVCPDSAELPATVVDSCEGDLLPVHPAEHETAAGEAARLLLANPPEKGVVRYTFKEEGPLGVRLSGDTPPLILDVHDGTLASKKAPRVPIGGIVKAVDGFDLSVQDKSIIADALGKRPVVLDVEWPCDMRPPNVQYA